jgi:hypothetical protein
VKTLGRHFVFWIFFFLSANLAIADNLGSGYFFSAAVLKNEGKPCSIEQAEKAAFLSEETFNKKANFSFGFSEAEYWFKIVVPPQIFPMILRIPFPVLDSVSFFAKDEAGIWREMQAGDCQPFSRRVLPFHIPAFPLNFERDKASVFYLKIKSEGSLTIPIEICSKDEFFYEGFTEQMYIGGLFGAVAVLILINFCLYFFFERLNCLFLAFNLTASLFFLLNLNGYWQAYFLGDVTAFANASMILSLILYSAAMAFYTVKSAALESHAWKYRNLLKKLGYFALFQLPLMWLFPFKYMVQVAILTGVLVAVFSFFAYLISRARGIAQVRYAVTGSYIYVIGIFISSLKFFGILEKTFFSEYGIETGVLMQAVFFTITTVTLSSHHDSNTQHE